MSVTTAPYQMLTAIEPPDDGPAGCLPTDRDPAPWESRMQATCECLSWRGTLDNLVRRHAEDELGETVYAKYPMYARSALVVAHSLMDQGIFNQQDLRAKMTQVRERMEAV